MSFSVYCAKRQNGIKPKNRTMQNILFKIFLISNLISQIHYCKASITIFV